MPPAKSRTIRKAKKRSAAQRASLERTRNNYSTLEDKENDIHSPLPKNAHASRLKTARESLLISEEELRRTTALLEESQLNHRIQQTALDAANASLSLAQDDISRMENTISITKAVSNTNYERLRNERRRSARATATKLALFVELAALRDLHRIEKDNARTQLVQAYPGVPVVKL
ncbi:hypothetical protein PLICRDRAFT_181232 [Plicaturopsis crispa FD-325 SS-3]|uniref:Uncharacterized protein n=1 Tax=Plicaturopsis crispa FD-325 SS-3 TaxID=944288 RepID=A0A0C9SJV2_PLICR|nr:hypothetical protein PLICRDRAFT_181232 [Plicaturopsis crispa FD-325 SS-3]